MEYLIVQVEVLLGFHYGEGHQQLVRRPLRLHKQNDRQEDDGD